MIVRWLNINKVRPDNKKTDILISIGSGDGLAPNRPLPEPIPTKIDGAKCYH